MPIGATMEGAALPANRDHLGELALRRAYEVHQLDAMANAANLEGAERYFAWLDPAGNPAGSLGFGLPAYIGIGQSQLAEVRIRRERAEAQVLHKVHESLSLMERALSRYNVALENGVVQAQHREQRQRDTLIGAGLAGAEMITAIQEEARVGVERIDAEYAYHIALCNLNRALYAGPFAMLSPERGRPRIERSLRLAR
jgi:hypothetical protein